MGLPLSGVPSAPVLLVCPTGGGKLSVRDVYSVIKGGVSLTISPLLSLGADQEEKLNLKASNSAGPVLAIHLDAICCLADQHKIINQIKGLLLKTHMAVYYSPSLRPFATSLSLVGTHRLWLIDNDGMSTVCFDEIHLFVHFGMTF
jgi:superfamily II DNA helicase RecQ